MLIFRIVLVIISLLLVLMLQGCGRKGPLFMPQPVPAKAAPLIVDVQPASAVTSVPPVQNLSPPTLTEIKK